MTASLRGSAGDGGAVPLILHAGALGDLALTIRLALGIPPFARAARIALFSRADPGGLGDARPAIHRRALDGLPAHLLYAENASAGPPWPELIRGRVVLSALGGCGSVVHANLKRLAPAALLSIDPRPAAGSHLHITEQWAQQLAGQAVLVGKCARARGRGVTPGAAARRRGGALLARAFAQAGQTSTASGAAPAPGPQRTIVIHPGSGAREKCWALDGFVEVARLCQAAGHDVAFVLGDVERERWPARDIERLAGAFAMLCEPTPDELLAISAAAGVLVGNDSGPAHLAALLGTPTVTLFGPTDARVWRPLGPRARVLVGVAGEPHRWGISAADVAGASAQALDRANSRSE